ncbi:MAG TPA: hypothetical protein VF980_03740 [Thermoanaerobaculia bacterium]
MDHPDVLMVLCDLANRGARLVDQQEVAAFIVQDASGAISCVLWPHTANTRSEHYDGRIPAGTVALAHTHPLFAEHPSNGDVAESKRLGLPIYVITRWNLYVTDPHSGEHVALIARKNWVQKTPHQECALMK